MDNQIYQQNGHVLHIAILGLYQNLIREEQLNKTLSHKYWPFFLTKYYGIYTQGKDTQAKNFVQKCYY